MHESAMLNMAYAIENALPFIKEGVLVLDVGSCIVEGQDKSYKELMEKLPSAKYIGCDIAPGNNVDVIMEEYTIPFPDNHFDLIITGNVIEHVEDLKRWVTELHRVLRSGGILIILCPFHKIPYHPYPIDCWRVMPDGMRFLLEKVCSMEVLYSDFGPHAQWGDDKDTLGVARKK